MMRLSRILAGVLLFLLLLGQSAFADCAVPSGYKRTGGSSWRFTEQVPGAPAFERLPTTVPADISANMKALGRMSTGLGIHIQTSADELHLCWDMTGGTPFYPNWSQSGVSGIDTYYRSTATGGQWRWFASGEATSINGNEMYLAMGTAEPREFLIYLTQNRRITQFRVDVPTAYSVSPGSAPTAGPIVVLGTSITQGSGTSRAGIAYPQALGRHYGVDTVNLGFLGACQMYEGMATLMATIPNPSAFYIDCFPNMSDANITAQMYAFVDILATAHPTVPIYIVQDRLNQGGGPHPVNIAVQAAKEAAALPIISDLVLVHSNVFWLPADDLLGDDYEGTVDGSHPSDLGHYRYPQDLIAQVEAL